MRYIFSLFVLVLMGCSPLTVSKSKSIKLELLPREKIILDSDSAVFWDDGAALAMLLRHSDQIEILGITLGLGNHWPYQGAEYMARVLKAMQRPDIPLYVGADSPLKNTKERMVKIEMQLILQGLVSKDGFWKGAYSRAKEVRSAGEVDPVKSESLSGIKPNEKNAVSFIIDTLNSSQEPITFVELGPMTNLATAIQRDPKIVTKIKRLLFMGGNIEAKGNTTPYAELNFFFDPEAAQIVLSSAIADKYMFPLDLSEQAIIDKKRFAELVAVENSVTMMLKADRGPKYENANYTTQSWDTTVAAFLERPDYITESRDLFLDIVTEPGAHYGEVVLQKNKEPNKLIHVIKKMNVNQFFSILRRDFSGN